jgi:nucleotide-binding universal stress UspA family protein
MKIRQLISLMVTVSVFAWTTEVYVAALPGVHEEMERQARERLEALLTAEERERYHATLALRSGSPFVEVVRYARDEGMDLIVLGTHGRGAIAHMLLGSVAERVVRKAHCPVVTVRLPEHSFVMP